MPLQKRIFSGRATTQRFRAAVLGLCALVLLLVLVETTESRRAARAEETIFSEQQIAFTPVAAITPRSEPEQLMTVESVTPQPLSPSVAGRLYRRIAALRLPTASQPIISSRTNVSAVTPSERMSFQEFLRLLSIDENGSLLWKGEPILDGAKPAVLPTRPAAVSQPARPYDIVDRPVASAPRRSGGNPIREDSDGKIEGHDHQGDAGGTTLSINDATTGTLRVDKGGTGNASYSTGDLLIGNASDGLSMLTVGNAGQVLTVANGSVEWTSLAPGFSTGNTLTISDARYVRTAGGTMTGTLVLNPESGLALNARGTISGSLITQNGAGNNYFMGNVGVGTSDLSLGDALEVAAVLNPTAGAMRSILTLDDETPNSSSNVPGVGPGIRFRAQTQFGRTTIGGIWAESETGYVQGKLYFAPRRTDGSLTPAMTILSTGLVGIGTTTPKAKLDVIGTISGSRLSISNNANISGALLVKGNVGIGTVSPAVRLDINGGSGESGIRVRGTASATSDANAFLVDYLAGTGVRYIAQGADTGTAGEHNFIISATDQSPFTTAMKINSSGNVGIGTTSPDVELELENATNARFHIDGGDQAFINIDKGGADHWAASIYSNQGVADWYTGTSDSNDAGDGTEYFIGTTSGGVSPALWIEKAGLVGIGTTTPKAKLDVIGTISGSRLSISNTANISGALLVKGNVGIGTTSPGARLEVLGNGAGSIKFGDAGVSNYSAISFNNGAMSSTNYSLLGSGDSHLYLNRVTGGDIQFRENNSTQMTLVAGGNLGIGNATTLSKLGVTGNLSVGSTYGVLAAPTSGMIVEGNVGIGSTSPKAKLDVLGTVSGSRLSISNTANISGALLVKGNVGIGTTAPSTKLDVVGAIRSVDTVNPYFQLSKTNATAATTYLQIEGNLAGNNFQIHHGGASRLDITSSGLVGIGTTAPKAKLDVVGTVSGSRLSISNTANISGALLVKGNVGIGTTSPGAKLEAVTDIRASWSGDPSWYTQISAEGGGAYLKTVGYSTLFLRVGATDILSLNGSSNVLEGNLRLSTSRIAGVDSLAYIDLYGTTTGNISIVNTNATSSAGNIRFLTAGSASENERMRIDSTGLVGIGTTTPKAKLDVVGTVSGSRLSISNNANISGALLVKGNVGIGTTSPVGVGTNVLHVRGNGTAGASNFGSISVSNPAGNTQDTWGSLDFYGGSTRGAAIIGASTTGGAATGKLMFYTNTSGSLDFVAAFYQGVLRIGTSGAGSNAESAGTAATRLALQGESHASTLRLLNLSNGATGANSNTEIGFGSTNSAASNIDVAVIRAIKSVATAGAEVGEFAFYTRNAGTLQESIRFAGDGSVGIGSTSPKAKLDVVGTVSGFTVLGSNGLITKVVSAACTDSNVTATDGAICIDSSNGRLYFRYGSAWHYAAQTAGFQIPHLERNGVLETEGLEVGDAVIGRLDERMADGALHGIWEKFDILSEVQTVLSNNPDLLGTVGSDTSSLNITDLTVPGALFVVGNANIFGNLAVHGTLSVSAKQAGEAIITAGGTRIIVPFDVPYSAAPIVTATSNDFAPWRMSFRSSTGFVIDVQDPATRDIVFTWLAIPTVGGVPPIPETPVEEEKEGEEGAVGEVGEEGEEGQKVEENLIDFPVDERGYPVSSDPLWNACIRHTPTYNDDGSLVSCSRVYLGNNQWEHPDLGVTFVFNDERSPIYLELPNGYETVVVPYETEEEEEAATGTGATVEEEVVPSDDTSPTTGTGAVQSVSGTGTGL